MQQTIEALREKVAQLSTTSKDSKSTSAADLKEGAGILSKRKSSASVEDCAENKPENRDGLVTECFINETVDQREPDKKIPKVVAVDVRDVAAPMPKEVILSSISPKHKKKAVELINTLDQSPNVTWDNNGLISVEKKVISGSSILEILPDIVYERKTTSNAKGLRELLAVIDFGTIEPPLPSKENIPDWFFLGRLDDRGGALDE